MAYIYKDGYRKYNEAYGPELGKAVLPAPLKHTGPYGSHADGSADKDNGDMRQDKHLGHIKYAKEMHSVKYDEVYDRNDGYPVRDIPDGLMPAAFVIRDHGDRQKGDRLICQYRHSDHITVKQLGTVRLISRPYECHDSKYSQVKKAVIMHEAYFRKGDYDQDDR